MATPDVDPYEVLQVRPEAHAAVIRAAFRALAALYHPDKDSSSASTRRMAQLNRAYELISTASRRALFDAGRQLNTRSNGPVITPPAPTTAKPAPQGSAAETLDFGRYQGLTITQLARQDPAYLEWLRRHSSGIRYRARIDAALGEIRDHSQPVIRGDKRR